MNMSVHYIRTFDVDQQLRTWRRWETLKFYPTKLTTIKTFSLTIFRQKSTKNNNNHRCVFDQKNTTGKQDL